MRFRGTLAARVSLLAAVAVGLSVALVASIAYVSVQHQLMASFDDSLQERAEGLAGLEPQLLVGQQLPEWLLGAADVRISLLLADGRSLRPPDLDALPDPVGGIEPTDREIAVARGTEPPSIRTVRTANGAYRVCVVPGKEGGTAVVLAQSLRPTQDTLGKLGVLLFLGGVVGVIAAALAGWAVARNGLRPVRSAQRRRRGDRPHRGAGPDPGRGQRRDRPAGHVLQRHAHGVGRLARPPAPARRRRRPRAAHPPDLAAHEPRPAGPG